MPKHALGKQSISPVFSHVNERDPFNIPLHRVI
jgi:hypothetical protein